MAVNLVLTIDRPTSRPYRPPPNPPPPKTKPTAYFGIDRSRRHKELVAVVPAIFQHAEEVRGLNIPACGDGEEFGRAGLPRGMTRENFGVVGQSPGRVIG